MDKNNNKRKNLTFGEKKEICEWKNNHPFETLVKNLKYQSH